MIEQFIEKRFNADHRFLIDTANDILSDYQDQGFTLTLRQLYYVFVSRGLIANEKKVYDKLSSVISKARMAGEMDWDSIEDRNRKPARWLIEEDLMKIISPQHYGQDMWANQDNYVEVWVEKDALSSIVKQGCRNRRVVSLACKGYLSTSEMYRSAKRFEKAARAGKELHLIHLGDHDPSGIDMTRDNEERVELMSWETVNVNRIALNMDQIDRFGPPPNPAKVTDSRAKDYIAQFGTKSWELDALEPSVLVSLIEDAIEPLVDLDQWEEDNAKEDEQMALLKGVQEHWGDIERMIRENWE